MSDKNVKTIKDLQKKPYNKLCFDCGQKVRAGCLRDAVAWRRVSALLDFVSPVAVVPAVRCRARSTCVWTSEALCVRHAVGCCKCAALLGTGWSNAA